MTWEQIGKVKREAVFSKIPKKWVIEVPSIEQEPNALKYLDANLPPEETAIVNYSMMQLIEKVSKGELTSIEITEAYCHRAALTHQIINCCSEIFFDKALKRAKELDEYYQRHGKTIGPLHGIPVSLKDQVNLEGLDSSIGFASKVNKPKTKDEESVIANILYDAGAVFYIKTTVPMAMMAGDTFSNIYGQTVNPLNRKLSAGGSSGGEGSLIAAKGALIGLSTDIGGSIRVPAAFQGLFAIRPSSYRLPYAKIENSMAYQPIVPSVIGPSARFLEDIKYFIKVIIDAKPWLYDPKTPPIPWRPYDTPSKLCFGIFKDSGSTHTHPPIARAIELTRQKLVEAGHEVIEWEPPVDLVSMTHNLCKIFVAEGYGEIKKECAKTGEPMVPQIIAADIADTDLTVSEHWAQAKLKYEAQLIYEEYWRNTISKTSTGRPVDAYISPAWESTSHMSGIGQPDSSGYTSSGNYLDTSSVIVPVTCADKTIDHPYEKFVPYTEQDERLNATYDPELFDGMPAVVQVITPRYEEERAIALAEVVYSATH